MRLQKKATVRAPTKKAAERAPVKKAAERPRKRLLYACKKGCFAPVRI